MLIYKKKRWTTHEEDTGNLGYSWVLKYEAISLAKEKFPALSMHLLLVYLCVTFYIPGFIVFYCPHVKSVRLKNNCLIIDNDHVNTLPSLFSALITLVLYL